MLTRIEPEHPRLPELLAAALDHTEEGRQRISDLLREAFPAAAQGAPGPSGQAVLGGLKRAVLSDYRVLGWIREPSSEIMEIDNALPLDLCKSLIEAAGKVDAWARSTQVRGSGAAYVNDGRTSRGVGLKVLGAELAGETAALLEAAGRLYSAWNPNVPPNLRPEQWEILRYDRGEHFALHVDAVGGHPTYGRRQLSVVAYLDEGAGDGETVFPRQGCTVGRRPGKAIVFPSSWTHPHAGAVVRTPKHVVVGWLSV